MKRIILIVLGFTSVIAFADSAKLPQEATVLEGLVTKRQVHFDSVQAPFEESIRRNMSVEVKPGLFITIDGVPYEIRALNPSGQGSNSFSMNAINREFGATLFVKINGENGSITISESKYPLRVTRFY
jgi:hypothetical protein